MSSVMGFSLSRVTRPLLIYPVAALAAFLTLLGLVAGRWTPMASWDSAVSARARAFGSAHPAWISVFRVMTVAGATVTFLAVGIALTVVFLVTRGYGKAVASGLVTVLVPVAWGVLHAILHRPRPVGGFVAVASNGFPSGHSANVSALALLSVLLIWPGLGRRGRVLAVTVAVVLAGSVGATRVALLAHWPSDVLGGWLLGVAVVLAVLRLSGRRPQDRHLSTRT